MRSPWTPQNYHRNDTIKPTLKIPKLLIRECMAPASDGRQGCVSKSIQRNTNNVLLSTFRGGLRRSSKGTPCSPPLSLPSRLHITRCGTNCGAPSAVHGRRAMPWISENMPSRAMSCNAKAWRGCGCGCGCSGGCGHGCGHADRRYRSWPPSTLLREGLTGGLLCRSRKLMRIKLSSQAERSRAKSSRPEPSKWWRW